MSSGSFEKSRLELVGTLQGHSRGVTSVSFSPDGTKVASGSYDNTVKLWDVTSGECLQTLEGHSSIVFSVSFSPDGTKVASFSESKAVGCDERGIYRSEMEIKSKKDAKVSIMQMRLARGTKGFVSSARKRQDQKMKFSRGKH